MADRPILFSGPMVRALLAGTKTQTRRVIKPQPFVDKMGNFCAPDRKGKVWNWGQHLDGRPCVRNYMAEHGKHRVGDRLYVREHWRAWSQYDDWPPRQIPAGVDVQYVADDPLSPWDSRFRQGMHMPRWASRITLIVTDVRVQRLQEISEEDARAEGIVCVGKYHVADSIASDPLVGCSEDEAWSHDPHDPTDIYDLPLSARGAYRRLWNQINGNDAWVANPWVAAYSFTVALHNIDQETRHVEA